MVHGKVTRPENRMSTFTKILLALAVVAAIVVAIPYSLLVASLPNPSWAYDIKNTPSPDDTRKVVVVVANCGATTPYVTAVHLVSTREEFDPASKNFFFAVKGINDIEIVWNENYYPFRAVPFKVGY